MTQSPVEDFTTIKKPIHSAELLKSRQVIRAVISKLGFSEEQELQICRQLINGIEDIIESL